MNLCSYGCGREGKYRFQNGKWCCSKSWNSCLENRRKNSLKNSGIKHPMYGKHSWNYRLRKENSDIIKKISEKISKKLKGRMSPTKNIPHKEETKEKMRKKKTVPFPASFRETTRKRMLNGQALRMIKNIKNPSKEELKLREIVKGIYQTSEHSYPIFNYAIDIVIPEYKIAIEYDGWYHFDTEEHKEYHSKRQIEIEQDGWKFLRYNIFQKFPTKEQVKEDILKILT